MSRVQRHHVRYLGHPEGELTVEVGPMEHRILALMQRLTRFSPGFIEALLHMLPGMWRRLAVIGEDLEGLEYHPRTRLIVDADPSLVKEEPDDTSVIRN